MKELIRPGGRLFESRQAIMDAVEASKYLNVVQPGGSMYAFIGVDESKFDGFHDADFALHLLETENVLVAPGSSFNVPYTNYFRVTFLPDSQVLADVFQRIERALDTYKPS